MSTIIPDPEKSRAWHAEYERWLVQRAKLIEQGWVEIWLEYMAYKDPWPNAEAGRWYAHWDPWQRENPPPMEVSFCSDPDKSKAIALGVEMVHRQLYPDQVVEFCRHCGFPDPNKKHE